MEKNVGEKLSKMNFKEDEKTLFTEILLAVVTMILCFNGCINYLCVFIFIKKITSPNLDSPQKYYDMKL